MGLDRSANTSQSENPWHDAARVRQLRLTRDAAGIDVTVHVQRQKRRGNGPMRQQKRQQRQTQREQQRRAGGAQHRQQRGTWIWQEWQPDSASAAVQSDAGSSQIVDQLVTTVQQNTAAIVALQAAVTENTKLLVAVQKQIHIQARQQQQRRQQPETGCEPDEMKRELTTKMQEILEIRKGIADSELQVSRPHIQDATLRIQAEVCDTQQSRIRFRDQTVKLEREMNQLVSSAVQLTQDFQRVNERGEEPKWISRLLSEYAEPFGSGGFDPAHYRGQVYQKYIFDFEGRTKSSHTLIVDPGKFWRQKAERPINFFSRKRPVKNVTINRR